MGLAVFRHPSARFSALTVGVVAICVAMQRSRFSSAGPWPSSERVIVRGLAGLRERNSGDCALLPDDDAVLGQLLPH